MLQNVDYTHENGVLTITVNTKTSLGPSKSGKTNIVGMTGGFEAIGKGLKFNLTVTEPRQ